MREPFENLRRMLGDEFPVNNRRPDWINTAGLDAPLPPTYVEWAKIAGGADLLHRYSNTDRFWFDPAPEHVVTTEYGNVLLFCRESQGNFELGVLMSTTADDPPVMFSDYTRSRWAEYCAHFTEAVLVQVFDWQHRLRTGEQIREIDYYEEFS